MKNNKGFSLVELIIVIAIMAILVGVMAPQLIKYIEKTNVSSDAQTCDSIRSAMTTAMLDPEVVNGADAGIPTDTTGTAVNTIPLTTDFGKAVKEILGITAWTDIKFKSHVGSATASGLTYVISNGNSVTVYLSSSDATGKKGNGSGTTQHIGAGPEIK